MEPKPDICPHCGGTETVLTKTSGGQGAVFREKKFFGKNLRHIICLTRGTVIRSYIEAPQDWA